MGKGGFDYNPDAVRGFAEVFNQAKIQIEQVKGTLGSTTAKAADFGRSWTAEGGQFEQYIQALVQDLGNLATNLGNIHANLMQGTDLVVNADTSAYQNIKSIETQLAEDSSSSVPPGAGGR
ncbi:MAG TPA: hypothetical protein VGX25_15065 [Actinophytocola sp.]|uniref:WXG100 family type VII secretion target n=1 Tax=Actinophytocola sp. TaxID=1872138 RepID=UPI002DDD6FAB|nr:hypothetical protein [Actinophytocola sp.]HEV2780708.1 hypothetical protein [Actinophytocola sp.]